MLVVLRFFRASVRSNEPDKIEFVLRYNWLQLKIVSKYILKRNIMRNKMSELITLDNKNKENIQSEEKDNNLNSLEQKIPTTETMQREK